MPEYTINISESDIETEEEVQGEKMFSLKNLIFGILAGGMDYVNEINRAIDEAYAER